MTSESPKDERPSNRRNVIEINPNIRAKQSTKNAVTTPKLTKGMLIYHAILLAISIPLCYFLIKYGGK